MEDSSSNDPPTHYANFVTVSVDPDVAYLELRRNIRPHREMMTPEGSTPPPTPGEVFAQEPIARVVLTYTAVKALHAALSDVIPKMEQARRGQS